MKKHLKVTAIGVLAAAGLASAAVAQQSNTQTAPANQSMNHQMMGQDGAMGDEHMMMMNDPEMRQQMMEMMESCSKMMEKMGSMSGMQQKPGS